MSWRDDFERKQMTADEAVKLVRDGDRVIVPLAAPRLLPAAVARRGAELNDVKVRLAAPPADPGFLAVREDGRTPWEIEFELFIGDAARFATDERRAAYLPNLFSTNFKAWDERDDGDYAVDVALVTVSPPNANGYVHFGGHQWNKRSYARRARTVLAEIDGSMIRPHGDCYMHVSEFDAFVEATPEIMSPEALEAILSDMEPARRAEMEPLLRAVPPEQLVLFQDRIRDVDPALLRRFLGMTEPPPEAAAIAGYLNEVLRDGDCIQIGVGDPSSLMPRLGAFEGKKDLGLHTEMCAPGIGRLVESGVINGSRKTLHVGKAVAGAWSGCGADEFAFIDDNPLFELYDQEYIVNIQTIARNANQTAINNAIAIDLIGQINSESVFGGRMINGTGGQPETHIGAVLAPGGRAITLLPSTALGGSVSRIVPEHDPGAIVTIPRFFADIVITEFGVARLLGKNHRQRAEELANVAHPDFRADLRAAARRMLHP